MLLQDQFIAEMPLREGATAIYIEKPIIANFRVSEVRCFDDHMQARITAIPTPGMIQGSLSSCTWKCSRRARSPPTRPSA